MEIAAVYEESIQKEIKRLLSLQDREPFSITAGCFDRTYWCWKFTDFPGARFQEGVYSLAHLYCHSFPGNELAGNGIVLEWIRAGFRYWQSIQYKDGSYDEAYPFEHSLAAVAFTGFYLGEAFLLIQDKIPTEERASIKRSFSKAADWLCENDEKHGVLSNHLAAAAAALCVIHRICADSRYQKRMQYFLEKIYNHQNSEGWYEEYGGADPGYQTHATFYLGRIWQITNDSTLFNSLQKSLEFLQYFFHPNKTLGGEYASRNTEFYYPAGFEILAPRIPIAASIANFMRDAVAEQSAAGLSAMDAYNFFPLLNNYLFAAKNARPHEEIKELLPCEKSLEQFYPSAGLYVKSNDHYYAVFGLSKGGTLKVYSRRNKKLLHCDAGYWAKTKNGEVLSHQSLSRPGNWTVSPTEAKIKSSFYKANLRVQKPFLFLGFRLFTLTLGRLPIFAYWLKNILVTILIKKSGSSALDLERLVRFGEKEIFCSDILSLNTPLDLVELKSHAKFSTIHMGSSRYFQPQELLPEIRHENNDKAQELMVKKRVFVTKKIEI